MEKNENCTNCAEERIKEEVSELLGVASITIDECFVIHDILILKSPKGDLFISMPHTKDMNGEYYDIAHPINSNARERITNAIIEAYNKLDNDKEESYV